MGNGGFELTIDGFIRAEVAGRVDAPRNWNNQNGNPFNNQTLFRQAYVPPNLFTNFDQLGALGIPTTPPIRWSSVPLPNVPGVLNNAAENVRRGDFVQTQNTELNYAILRTDFNTTMRFGHGFTLTAKVRAMFQPDVYDGFHASSLDAYQGGIATGSHVGPSQLYGGGPNFFQYVVDGDNHPVPLEWSGKNYLVYFPALVLEYSHGSMNLRIGNQQIAWGQAIFLRVFDVPNGLDLRQHLLLDRGLEEFSNIRVPSPSIRLQYQVTDNVLLDSFVEKFQPSYLPNPNTPYNLIPSQFTIRDTYYTGGYSRWTSLNGGFRLKADYGNWGWQLGFVRGYNPMGAYAWSETGIARGLQGGPGSVGQTVNTLYAAKLPNCGALYSPSTCRLYPDNATNFTHSPFVSGPGGVYTAQEWDWYASNVRVSSIGALNAAINEYPSARDTYGSPVTNNVDRDAELSTFFAAAGGSLRGSLDRRYFQENDFLAGLTYVTSSNIAFLDQIIVNLEAQYTPKFHFLLSQDASASYYARNNYKIAIDLDKWYRFFEKLPSTFVVLEAMTSQRADLVGRCLCGYGGTPTQPAQGISGNANYVVLGAMQPFANKLFTFEFASLYDPRGGILVQPGLVWNPGHNIEVYGAFNYINGHMYGNPNDNLLSSLDFAQEAFLRVTYQFSM
ncbi:MAG: hypothetical protein EPN72_11870 [Nevskiaceae bacterium]|nr:MAG: hypothetical protein EPN63_01105 [Nevskiaceae bacterium]TBR71884.1 MAG: hypothetical protein EPN72_11870 [Nevskiaceae bacterium]